LVCKRCKAVDSGISEFALRWPDPPMLRLVIRHCARRWTGATHYVGGVEAHGFYGRLSVFVAGFTPLSAQQVAAGMGVGAEEVFRRGQRTLMKSLASADNHGIDRAIRLLDTTRTDAALKLADLREERDQFRRAHPNIIAYC